MHFKLLTALALISSALAAPTPGLPTVPCSDSDAFCYGIVHQGVEHTVNDFENHLDRQAQLAGPHAGNIVTQTTGDEAAGEQVQSTIQEAGTDINNLQTSVHRRQIVADKGSVFSDVANTALVTGEDAQQGGDAVYDFTKEASRFFNSGNQAAPFHEYVACLAFAGDNKEFQKACYDYSHNKQNIL